MKSYYPPLIFDIILSVLKQAEFRVGQKTEYHYLDTYLYNEIGEDNFEVLELFSLNAFYNLDTFFLIDCGIYFGDHPYPPFVFRMGMDKCNLIFEEEGLASVDALRFKGILPEDIENESWMDVLATFIDIVNFIIDNNIKIEGKATLN